MPKTEQAPTIETNKIPEDYFNTVHLGMGYNLEFINASEINTLPEDIKNEVQQIAQYLGEHRASFSQNCLKLIPPKTDLWIDNTDSIPAYIPSPPLTLAFNY